MKLFRTLPKRLLFFSTALILLFGIVFPVILPTAHAAQLQKRQLSISSSANGTITQNIAGVAAAAGSGGNGQKTAETYTFNIATAGTVGSMLIQFCDDPIKDDPCFTPNYASSPVTGLDASHVSAIQTQSCQGTGTDCNGGSGSAGAFTNAYSVDTSTNLTGSPWNCVGSAPGRTNCIAINAATANTLAVGDTVVMKFGGTSGDYITNPTADNTPFYARIYTFSTTSGYALVNVRDYGTVVGSTAQQIDITAKVKEVLNFSVSATASTVPGQTCTALDGTTNPDGLGAGGIKLGDVNGVLSFNTSYAAHSYFRLSSNTLWGVQVYYSGDTLKNGSNAIDAIASNSNFLTNPGNADFSFTGMPQFGLAIDSSDTQGGNGYSFTNLAATTQYANGSGNISNTIAGGEAGATGAKFAFDTASVTTPVSLATAAGPVACDTGSVRYIGNISTATPAGIYTTTITYIATGKY